MTSEMFSDTVISSIVSVDHMFRSKSYQASHRPYHAIIYKLSGETVYRSDQQDYIFSAGTVLFLPQGSTYRSVPSIPGESITVNFTCNPCESLPQTVTIINTSGKPVLSSSFKELEHRWTFKKPGYSPRCFALLYSILADVSKSAYNPTMLSKSKNLADAIAYLEDNFADPTMDINVLAEKAKLSSSHFRRLFTDIYGMSPGRYLRSIRIAKAKDLLIAENLSIGEIAELTGYANLYYFSKAFKKETGKSPSAYKK